MDITRFIVEEEGAPSSPCSCGVQGEGRTYYGNAEPEGATVIIGGREVVAGGWAAHEVERRRAHWDANPRDRRAEPSSRYKGRTYVSGQDTLESIFADRDAPEALHDPLPPAAHRLANALEALDNVLSRRGASTVWDRLGIPQGGPVVAAAITPDDIRCAAPETDVAELHRLAEDVAVLTASYSGTAGVAPAPPAGLPPLPRRTVSAYDNEGIARLEKGTLPRAETVEAYRAAVAAQFDAAATVLEAVVKRGTSSATD